MSYLVSATVDDLSRVSGVRHNEQQALELALSYQRQGYKEIRVDGEDAVYTLEQFRRLVE
jgi:hypothetical protein